MENKIISIVEKIPRPAKLSDGCYIGYWCSRKITIQKEDKYYELETEGGPRSRERVVVTIKDGVGTFEELNN